METNNSLHSRGWDSQGLLVYYIFATIKKKVFNSYISLWDQIVAKSHGVGIEKVFWLILGRASYY